MFTVNTYLLTLYGDFNYVLNTTNESYDSSINVELEIYFF